MPIEDIDREMKQLKTTTAAAYRAFDEQDYVTSGQQLLLSAQKLKTIYAPDHPDVLKCLLTAGDSYYYLDRFGDAAKAYLELQSIIESSNAPQFDRSVFYFKLAKTFDRAKQFDDAEKIYVKALTVSEKTLSASHPLLTIVMESYASFLRHIRKNPAAAASLEERAAALRERNKEISGLYENYLEPLKRKPEPVHSANLHERHSSSRPPDRSNRLVDGVPYLPQNQDRMNFFKTRGFKVSVLLVVLGVLTYLAGQISSKWSYFNLSEEEEPRPKPPTISFLRNGGFEPRRGYRNNNFLQGWQQKNGPISVVHTAETLAPSDGIQFINLGWTGQIEDKIHVVAGARYSLIFDVASDVSNQNPVIIYSIDALNWRPANVDIPHHWHTERYSFVPDTDFIKLTFASGSATGTKERYIDNIRLFLVEYPKHRPGGAGR